MANEVQPWIKEAAQEFCYSIHGWQTKSPAYMVTRVNRLTEVIAAHIPAPSELERQVREHLDSMEDGTCSCEDFMECNHCVTYNRASNFFRYNAVAIARALVNRLPKEEK